MSVCLCGGINCIESHGGVCESVSVCRYRLVLNHSDPCVCVCVCWNRQSIESQVRVCVCVCWYGLCIDSLRCVVCVCTWI